MEKEASKMAQPYKYFPFSHLLFLILSDPFLLTYDLVKTLIALN